MKRSLRLVPWISAVPLLFAACDDFSGPITALPRSLSVAEGKLVEADNRFAFSLFREINAQQVDTNVFVSPLSVAMALGMTLNGAAGATEQAMVETLALQGLTRAQINEAYRSLIDLLRNLDPNVEFLLANSIWHESTLTFEQEFLDINTGYFDAQVTPLDFAAPGAAATINGWVSDNTRGKIREIVPDPIPRDIIMYLINAIYFKGDWTYRFDENLTRATPFTLADGSQKTVNMMSHANPVTIAVAEVGDLTVADLPYSGDAYCMTILLPDMPDGLQALVEELTQENWNAWTSVLADDDREVSLPKFTLEYEIKLNDVLTALGMGVAFSAGADFTRVFRPGGIWIDEVKHKTYVDVNEEGTEAAAVTSVAMARGMASRAILVDRPFLFVIREKLSGTILFMGKVVDPTRG